MNDLETDRLLGRGWRDDDLEPFAAINADETVMAFYPATLSRQQSDALAARFEQSLEEDGFGPCAVVVKATRHFIGYVGLSMAEIAAPFTPAVEVGWRLSRASWGHGYATEAARACLGYGFFDSRLGFVQGLGEIVSFTGDATKNLSR